MKKYAFLFAVLFFAAFAAKAQYEYQPYNVVFDLTSKDTVNHKNVMKWIKEITDNHDNYKVEVVLYGQSLDMVTKGKSVVEKDILKYADKKNVSFKVCQIAMKAHNLEASQLIKGVDIVPDGIFEIVIKEKAGLGYIKVGNN